MGGGGGAETYGGCNRVVFFINSNSKWWGGGGVAWGRGGGGHRKTVNGNGVKERGTLRASLSGTFLQTPPDLVTPLKGHSLSRRCCPATWSAPSERFGY